MIDYGTDKNLHQIHGFSYTRICNMPTEIRKVEKRTIAQNYNSAYIPLIECYMSFVSLLRIYV